MVNRERRVIGTNDLLGNLPIFFLDHLLSLQHYVGKENYLKDDG